MRLRAKFIMIISVLSNSAFVIPVHSSILNFCVRLLKKLKEESILNNSWFYALFRLLF